MEATKRDETTAVALVTRMRYEISVYLFFGFFLNNGAHLNPMSSKIGHTIVFMVLVVYLGHGSFHPVAVIFLSRSGFWG